MELDEYAEEDRDTKDKTGKGNAHIPRRRGEAREQSELPTIRGATVNRHLIPRYMVNPAWLLTAKGRAQDNAVFMDMTEEGADSDGEWEDVVVGEDAAEGEGVAANGNGNEDDDDE